MLDERMLPRVQRALADAGLDGWLIYDFHGLNPVAPVMLGLDGMMTRRIFALIPATGMPTAITHAIEQGPWAHWPTDWNKQVYSSWRTLEQQLGGARGWKASRDGVFAGDAVPYLDRVPAGVLEMVRAAGATVVTSAELVTAFYATWTRTSWRSIDARPSVSRDCARVDAACRRGSARGSTDDRVRAAAAHSIGVREGVARDRSRPDRRDRA